MTAPATASFEEPLPLPSEPPRVLNLQRPVRLVLVGGFLGAGKTTALTTLARSLTQNGLRVGVVTNDQAADLVDTVLVRQAGLPVAEVAGGCFCCRFTDLLDAAQSVLDTGPDVLLCEPVGSCTDMVATVLAPLRHFYGDLFQIAPFSVLVDPARVRELVLRETPSVFAREAGYIFRKQLEEADLIVLNKTDRLSAEDVGRMAGALEAEFGKPVLKLSAAQGDGMAEWSRSLLGGLTAGEHLLREIDYDTYAAGEAVLGWLNASVQLKGTPTFDPAVFVRELMAAIRQSCQEDGVEIAHVKVALSDADHLLRANATATSEGADQGSVSWSKANEGTLVLNARVQTGPDRLKEIATRALGSACERSGAVSEISTLQSFSPGYPRPPYRVSAN